MTSMTTVVKYLISVKSKFCSISDNVWCRVFLIQHGEISAGKKDKLILLLRNDSFLFYFKLQEVVKTTPTCYSETGNTGRNERKEGKTFLDKLNFPVVMNSHINDCPKIWRPCFFTRVDQKPLSLKRERHCSSLCLVILLLALLSLKICLLLIFNLPNKAFISI